MGAKEEIWAAIQASNQSWLNGNPGEVASLFHDDVVMYSVNGAIIRGRDALVRSYEDYCTRARTLSFDEIDPDIEVFGDTARASYRFHVEYELDGHKHDEDGREVLVFTRENGRWWAILRMNFIQAPVRNGRRR